jgi:hypothetical protein
VGPLSFSFGYPVSWGMIMPTAIVSVYTPEGFLIGADGMRRDQRTGEVKDLEARKIFFIEHDELVFAYGWAGGTGILSAEGESAFSFLNVSCEVGNTLRPLPEDSFIDYAQDFFGEVVSRLKAAKDSGRITRYPTAAKSFYGEDRIAGALLVGYFRGRPSRAQVEFAHINQNLLPPKMSEAIYGNVPSDFKIFTGSAMTYDEIKSTRSKPPESLSDGAKLIRGYIEACIRNQARFDDCQDIGGRIHIAAVTPQGRKWMDPPGDAK